MPGSGDYFQEFLVNDFSALDKEMGGSQWFQKEQERDSQRELSEQNELEKGRVEEEKESPASSTADPFRPTYDRKKSSESKKERLERIKKEYEHKPFISVGAWEDLRKRRDKRKQVQQQIVDQSFRDGLSANSPNLTQEVEQNEPTIMPMPKFNSLKGFCKKATWEDEDDPTKAADWWKPEEERNRSRSSGEDWKGEKEKEHTLDDWVKAAKDAGMSVEEFQELMRALLAKPHQLTEEELLSHLKHAREMAEGMTREVRVMEQDPERAQDYADTLEADGVEFTSPTEYVWVMIREEQEKIKELEKELAARREGTPSSEDLETWLKSSGTKRFCKKAKKVKNKLASLEDIDAAREALLSAIEKGFDNVRALGLETSLNPVADVFEKELAHPENTLGSIFSNEQYVDFIGVRLRSLLIELRRIVSQYEQNPEIAKNVKAIIKSLEKIRDKHGL